MRILVLGGIAEAQQLALDLTAKGHYIIYSIAGMVRHPDLPCKVHTGGFSSADEDGILGMHQFCIQHSIERLIDATHPYAITISEHIAAASQLGNLPCWRFQRPCWQASDFPNWHGFDSWETLWPKLYSYKKVFFTTGLSALKLIDSRPTHQNWVIRSAQQFDAPHGITPIEAIGPFSYTKELSLLQQYNIDALVCKNSGSDRVVEKLNAAKTLGIPIFVQRRPKLPTVEHVFGDINLISTSSI